MLFYYSGVRKYQVQKSLQYQAGVTPALAERRRSKAEPVPLRWGLSHSLASRSRKPPSTVIPARSRAHAGRGSGSWLRREARRGPAADGREGGAAGPARRAAPWRLPPAELSPWGQRQRSSEGTARHLPAVRPRAGLASGDTRATAAAVRRTDRSGPPLAATWFCPEWPRWRRPELSTRCGAEVSARHRGAGGNAASFLRRAGAAAERLRQSERPRAAGLGAPREVGLPQGRREHRRAGPGAVWGESRARGLRVCPA